MAPRELEQRVENIEETLQVLNTLPARVGSLETQFLQFRGEVRMEFSAVRGEMHRLHDEALAHSNALHQEAKGLVRGLQEQIEMLATHFTELHREMREGFKQLRSDRV